MTSVAYGLW